MKMTDAVLSTSSVTKTTRVAPSALIKSAHLIERIGLATLKRLVRGRRINAP